MFLLTTLFAYKFMTKSKLCMSAFEFTTADWDSMQHANVKNKDTDLMY